MRLSIKNFNLIDRYPTHWGDEDAARHINNLVYMRWAETMRVKYFEAMGMDINFAGDVPGPILAWQECKYIFPMTHPDTAIVGVRTIEIDTDRFMLETGIFSEKHDRLAAINKQLIVPYNYAKLEKAPLPVLWVKGIQTIDPGLSPSVRL